MSFQRDGFIGTTASTLYPMASGVTTSFIGNPLDVSAYEGEISITLMGKGATGSTLDLCVIPSGLTGVAGAPVARFTQVTSAGLTEIKGVNVNEIDAYICPSGTVVGSVSFGIAVNGRKKII